MKSLIAHANELLNLMEYTDRFKRSKFLLVL